MSNEEGHNLNENSYVNFMYISKSEVYFFTLRELKDVTGL